MTQLVRLDDRAKALQAVFTANMPAMAKMIPRTQGDPTRLIRIAYNSVAYDPALLDCSKTPQGMASIFGGVMEALKLGLTIGGPAQESWLIPFKNKGVLEATLIIGYQGFRNILDRSKSVIDLHPRIVYENDEFGVNFGTNKVHHVPYWLRQPPMPAPGPVVAVYAIAHLARGGIQIEVMPKREIDKHREKSRAKDSGPWVNFYDAMALKTVVRKIAKYLPKSSEILMRALDLDDKADRGVPQDYDVASLVFDEVVPASKQVGSSRLDDLKKKLEDAKTPAEMKAIADPIIAEAEAQNKESEKLLREIELDEALATIDADERNKTVIDRMALGNHIAEEDRMLDQEIATRDAKGSTAPPTLGDAIAARTPMDQLGDLLGPPPRTVDDVKSQVEKLRMRAEELAKRRR